MVYGVLSRNFLRMDEPTSNRRKASLCSYGTAVVITESSRYRFQSERSHLFRRYVVAFSGKAHGMFCLSFIGHGYNHET